MKAPWPRHTLQPLLVQPGTPSPGWRNVASVPTWTGPQASGCPSHSGIALKPSFLLESPFSLSDISPDVLHFCLLSAHLDSWNMFCLFISHSAGQEEGDVAKPADVHGSQLFSHLTFSLFYWNILISQNSRFHCEIFIQSTYR